MSVGNLRTEADLSRWLHGQLARPGMFHASRIQGEKPLARKAGIPTDADYATEPPDGTQVLDTSNQRLYVRVNGSWKYQDLI